MSQKQAIILIMIIVFFGAFYGVKKSGFIAEKARVIAEKRLQLLVNQPVKVEAVSLTLFSSSVVLSGIASTGETPFSVKKARVSFSLWSFLTQSVVIRKITIQHPSVSLNAGFEFKKRRRNPSVIIRAIHIEDGTVTYKTDRHTFLAHIGATIFPDFSMNRFDIKAMKVVLNHNTALSAEGVVNLSEQLSDPLNIQVTATAPIEEYLSLLSVLKLPPLSGNLNLKGRVRGTVLHPTITGKMSIPRLFAARDNKTVASDKQKRRWRHLGSLQSDFSYNNAKKLNFSHIVFKLFSGEGSGEGEIGFPTEVPFAEGGQYSLKLQYDRLALNAILAIGIPAIFPPKSQTGWLSSIEGMTVKGGFSLSGQGGRFTTEGNMGFLMADNKSPMNEGNVAWTGSEKEIRIHQATVSFPGGNASFPGTFRPKEGWALKITIDSHEIKSVAETIPLPIPVTGQLHLQGTVSGHLSQPFFSGHLRLHDWTLKQRPLGPLQTNLFYYDKTLLFQEGIVMATLNHPHPIPRSLEEGDPHGDKRVMRSERPMPLPLGTAKFGGTVRFGKRPSYYFSSEIASVDPQEVLQFFTPLIALTTKATGRIFIEGEGAHLTVHGPLRVGEGTLYGESFKKGSLYLTVTEKKVHVRTVQLEKEEGRVDGEGEISYKGAYILKADSAHFPIEKVDLLRKYLPGFSGATDLTIRGNGSIKKPDFNFFAKAEKLRYRDMAMGSGTIHADWQGNGLILSSRFPEKKFVLTGKLKTAAPFPFLFQSRFENIPLHTFLQREAQKRPGLLRMDHPLDIALHGDGEISGTGYFSRLHQLDLTSRFKWLSARFGDYILTNNGPIEFYAKRGAFVITEGAFKGTNTDLSLSGGLTPLKEWGVLLKGTADLNLLRLFTPKVRSGKGIAHIDLSINDRWQDPKIQGVLSLQDGMIYFADFDQPVIVSSLGMVFNKRRLILETIEGKMGRGRFSGKGAAMINQLNLAQFGFQLDLTEMPIYLTRDLTAVTNGALLFRGNEISQLLSGSLEIRKAVYEKRIDLRQMLAKWREKREEHSPIEIPLIGSTALNIHLFGKENIAVDNNLAKVALNVDLQMKGTISKPLLFGQIDIPKGTFNFRANKFKVVSGTVQFIHPREIDPIFDIKGESKFRNYTIGLSLVGVLAQFDLALTSFPSLPEADILSLLAVGKTTEEVTNAGGEATTFIAADVISGFLAEPIKKMSGVEMNLIEAGGDSQDPSRNTLISFEKRLLDDKLLVVYSTPLDPSKEEGILFFYELGKNLSVAGGRDEEGQTGGDLRFRFEFH